MISMNELIFSNLKTLNINQDDVVKLTHYGSRVYGTAGKDSDFDYIAVVKDHCNVFNDTVRFPDCDISIYSISKYIELLNAHEISVIESLFCPKEFVIINNGFEPKFNLNLSILRSSFSQKASNSFVKARKKVAIGEYYIGKKSLWHSFRIILFGIQIAKEKKLIDFAVANYLHDDIVSNPSVDPEYYKMRYLKPHNELMTQFRLVAPK